MNFEFNPKNQLQVTKEEWEAFKVLIAGCPSCHESSRFTEHEQDLVETKVGRPIDRYFTQRWLTCDKCASIVWIEELTERPHANSSTP